MTVTENKQVLGMIGVYFIGMELSKNGLVAVPTVRNVKATDMLVTDLDGRKAITLQVKTRKGEDFPVASFSEEPSTYEEGNEWFEDEVSPSPTKLYAFVQVDEQGNVSDYWIVPSEEVLKAVRKVRDDYHGGPYKDKPTTLVTRGKRAGKPVQDLGAWAVEPDAKYRRRLDLIQKLLDE